MTGWNQISSKTRRYDVFRPATTHPHQFAVVLLRDEEGLLPTAVREDSMMQWFVEMQMTVVAPETGPLWALDVPCSESMKDVTPRQVLVEEILPQVKQLTEFSSPRLGLLGFGMGGQAALRIAYDYPQQFPVVAAIEPKIDFHLHVRYGHEILSEIFADDELARQHTAILHIHPLNWPRKQYFCCDPESDWFDSSDRLRMKLAASGIPFDADLESTGDGNSDAYLSSQTKKAMEFLLEGLESERLRLV